MISFNRAVIKTAGAYIAVGDLYPFAIGSKLHNGNIPVVRLGGHVVGTETGWECARREVREEASIRIRPGFTEKTYWVCGDHRQLDLQETEWARDRVGGCKPILVVAYSIETQPLLSLMYLAQSNEPPTPSGEVKGILLLDPESIDQICQGSMTLDQYLKRGGKAVLNGDFDLSLTLEPFIQLRIFARLLKAQLV